MVNVSRQRQSVWHATWKDEQNHWAKRISSTAVKKCFSYFPSHGRDFLSTSWYRHKQSDEMNWVAVVKQCSAPTGLCIDVDRADRGTLRLQWPVPIFLMSCCCHVVPCAASSSAFVQQQQQHLQQQPYWWTAKSYHKEAVEEMCSWSSQNSCDNCFTLCRYSFCHLFAIVLETMNTDMP